MITTVETADWTLEADTDNPLDPADWGVTVHRALVTPLVATWTTADGVYNPVRLEPSTISVAIVDDGAGADGFLAIELGTPIHVSIVDDAVTIMDVTMRAGEPSGKNVDQGILFTVICTDPLADLQSTQAPTLIATSTIDLVFNNPFGYAVEQIADDAGWTSDPAATVLDSYNPVGNVRDWEFNGTSSRDAIDLACWANVGNQVALGWLPDPTGPDADDLPEVAIYTDPSYLPSPALLGVLTFSYTGSQWVLVEDVPGYYTGGGDALVLTADQLARDVGEWRKQKSERINTAEISGSFSSSPTVDVPPLVETIRRSNADLVRAYGRNTRSIENVPYVYDEDARYLGDWTLGIAADANQDATPTDYGPQSLTIAWETLTADQRAAWGASLWPTITEPGAAGHRFAVTPAIDAPIAVFGVPDKWRPFTGPAVFGRLAGVVLSLEADTLRVICTVRAVPPNTSGSITYTEIDALSPDVTYTSIDPTITYDQLALVEG